MDNLTNLKHKVILIGSSAGGPNLIEKIIKNLPFKFDAIIIIAQHMNPEAIESFSFRLKRQTAKDIMIAEEKTELKNNAIFILKNNFVLKSKENFLYLEPSDITTIYHPSINLLFKSASYIKNIQIVSYILSGMGNDGVEGLGYLKTQNHLCIAQDKKSSIIYGMPKAAKEAKVIDKILSIDEISQDINRQILYKF